MSTQLEQTGVGEAWYLELPGADGGVHSLSALSGRQATAIVFLGGGCPTARSYVDRLNRLQTTWCPHGVSVVAINANNPYLSPPDTLAEMRKRVGESGLKLPYLKDPQGTLARAFGAVCTPHAFLVDSTTAIVYRGRIDDSRVGDTVTRHELEDAISAVVAAQPVPVPETEPFGCSIIW